MAKVKKTYIVVKFDHDSRSYDYPQNLPLPRTGDKIMLGDLIGTVYAVTHSVTSDLFMANIYIHCK
jgi:hypothetical protein